MNALRTLVIAQNLPYPTFAGMDLRNWQNVNGLRGVGEVGVFGLQSNDPRRDKPPPVNLAFWRASSDPALSYPLPDDKLTARAWLLDPRGHPSDLYYSESAVAEIADLISSFKPHLVVVEELWLHRYIPVLKRHGCPIVLDLHNAETAKFRQMGDATHGNDLRAKVLREILPVRVKVIEQEATHTVDQIWVCSDIDAGLIEEIHRPPVNIHVVPNAVNVENYRRVRDGRCPRPKEVALARNTVIFPSVFHWEPSAEAAKFLIDEVFPRLADIFPDCHLLLPGGQPTSYMIDAARKDGRIMVIGVVSDMLPYFAAATVMAVPLFKGGGTRLKILEAFASNLPVVSTAKGAEGLKVKDGTHLLIAETAEEFVTAVKRLWTDEGLAGYLASKGLELVEKNYSWKVIGQRIGNAVHELFNAS
jgi:glycosyltransferase involved in cell wall biosynthesis